MTGLFAIFKQFFVLKFTIFSIGIYNHFSFVLGVNIGNFARKTGYKVLIYIKTLCFLISIALN